MKKITALFMSLFLVFPFAACGNQNSGTDSQTSQTASGSTRIKMLVICYPASGNTKTAAGYIAAATDADIFELVPSDPYSDDDLDRR